MKQVPSKSLKVRKVENFEAYRPKELPKVQNFEIYLRNIKHLLCFYQVIETQVKVWENEKCCGNTSRRQVFQQLFRVLPNFHKCFDNLIEAWQTCFLFLLEKNHIIKCKFSLLTPSLRQQLVLVSIEL